MTSETLLEKLIRDCNAYVFLNGQPRWIAMNKFRYVVSDDKTVLNTYQLTAIGFWQMCQDLGIDS